MGGSLKLVGHAPRKWAHVMQPAKISTISSFRKWSTETPLHLGWRRVHLRECAISSSLVSIVFFFGWADDPPLQGSGNLKCDRLQEASPILIDSRGSMPTSKYFHIIIIPLIFECYFKSDYAVTIRFRCLKIFLYL